MRKATEQVQSIGRFKKEAYFCLKRLENVLGRREAFGLGLK